MMPDYVFKIYFTLSKKYFGDIDIFLGLITGRNFLFFL